MSFRNSVLIVGDGLCAHVLAHQVRHSGKNCLVMGKELPGAASPAAWGLLNPVHFRSYSLSWGASWYAQALDFYSGLEKELQVGFMRQLPLWHFDERQEAPAMWRKAWEEALFGYVNLKETPAGLLGCVEVPSVAVVSVPNFLKASRIFLKKHGGYVQDYFTMPSTDHTIPKGYLLEGHQIEQIVWAQGWRVGESGPFGALPIRPSKGEGAMFAYESPKESPKVLHRNLFAYPENGGNWRVGSTYSWDDATHEPSETGLAALKNGFERLMGKAPAEILDQWAGFRPTSPDRKPMVGPHPLFSSHFIFNGMGSKGLLLAPVLAQKLVETLYGRKDALPVLAHVDRFRKRLVTFKA